MMRELPVKLYRERHKWLIPERMSLHHNQKYDILLTICPPWDIVSPPLGLAYLSTYLEESGFRPKVIDLNIELYHQISKKLQEVLWGFSSFTLWEQQSYREMGDFEKHVSYCVNRLLSVDTEIIGFSLYHANVGMSIEIARRIKQANKGVKIIFGGPSCTDPFDRSMIPLEITDYIILGEGEFPLAEALRRLKEGREVRDVVGVFVPGEGENCKPKGLVLDLNKIPFPAYRDFALGEYTSRMLRLIGSRGCVGRCKFCNENYYTGKYRARSAENIFAEISYHVQQNKISWFKFSDQLINGKLWELERLCDLIVASGYQIEWEGQAIPRRGMTFQLLNKMRKAGCYRLDYGLETGSKAISKKMTKPFPLEDAETVISLTHDASITTCINIIVGFPGEGEEEFSETLEFLKRNRNHIDKVSNLSTCFVKPFSDLHLNPQNYGIAIPEEAYFWYKWQDPNLSDNYDNDQRIAKLKRIVSVCEELAIPIDNTYVFK